MKITLFLRPGKGRNSELRQSFNREQVALEEYISNSYYSSTSIPTF